MKGAVCLTVLCIVVYVANGNVDIENEGQATKVGTSQRLKHDENSPSHFSDKSPAFRKARPLKYNKSSQPSIKSSKRVSSNVDEDPMAEYLARQDRLQPDKWGVTLACELCVTLYYDALKIIKESNSSEEMIEKAVALCIANKLYAPSVCEMGVRHYKDYWMYIATHLTLSPQQACGLRFGMACTTPYYPGPSWNVTLPDTPKPTPKPPTPPKPDAPTLRVLHFTDIHIDFQYKEGANTHCPEGVCCRANENQTLLATGAAQDSDTAGKYGTYTNCDAPVSLAEAMFRYLSATQDDFDFVIFTGDIPAHDTWNQTKSDQTEHLIALDRMFLKYLPNKPVYYCIGNHESSPVSNYPPPGVPGHDLGWLYGSMASIWGRWLPESAVDTTLQCGGYSTSPYPGFRIISVNTNYCNGANYWLLLNSVDPCDVLKWLVEELQSAEDNGEKVHILTHIPPGDNVCWKMWSHGFYKIVNRYENTIVNQFYGHVHHDYFQMFYDDVNFKRPVGVGFALSSVTPDSSGNPIYRIYTIDGNYPNSSWAVLDYETYYLNLTEANMYDNVDWKIEYSPKTAFNMNSLYASDWEDLVQRMDKDDELFQMFYKFYTNNRPSKKCEGSCKDDLLCTVKEGRSYDPELCKLH